MTPVDHLAWLRGELYAFGDCLHAPLSTPIEHCADWTLYDLADHVGRGNLSAAAAVTRQRGDHRTPAAPKDPSALRVWFAASAIILLTVLDTEPSLPAWSFAASHTVGFWQRRQCLELLVHRWDAGNALGAPDPIDPVLAGDGIAEVFDVIAPWQVDRGHAVPPMQAVRFAAADTGTTWVYGPGEPVATVTAPAAELLLVLWGRRALDTGPVSCDGDQAAVQTLLNDRLVP